MKLLSVIVAVLVFIAGTRLCAESVSYSVEAARIAVDAKGTLRPDVELATKLTEELAILRSTYPGLVGVEYHGTSMPSEVFGVLSAEGLAAYTNDPEGFLAPVKEDLGEFTVRLSDFGPYLTLSFVEIYNSELLAQRVSELLNNQVVTGPFYINEGELIPAGYTNYILSKKIDASPNIFFGDGGGLYYDYDTGIYSFMVAGGDCPSGCIYKRTWHFNVTEGEGLFLEVSGAELPEVHIEEPSIGVRTSRVTINSGAKLAVDNGYPRGMMRYEWYKDGVLLLAQDDGNLLLESVQESDSGEYHCVTIDVITEERMDGRPFDLVVKPDNYLWKRDEITFSMSWDWYGLAHGHYTPFGFVDARHEPLVYIHGLGWLYVDGTYDGPVWMYDSELGWCYTTVEAFPFIYGFEDSEWYYFEQSFWTGTHKLLYGFGREEWVFVPFSAMVDW